MVIVLPVRENKTDSIDDLTTQAPRPRDRAFDRTVPVLAAIATLISLTGSWIPSFWGDEGASVMSATRSIPSLLSMLGTVDAVHGTYYLFLHAWVSLVGASPFSVRLPSALAVGALVAAVALISRRLSSPRVAIAAAIICMVIPRVTYFGEEARSYAFAAAIAAWLTLLLLTMMEKREPSARHWVVYTALLAFGIYSFLFLILIAISHAVVLLSVRTNRQFFTRWAASTAVAIVVASPIMVFALREKNQIAFLSHGNELNFRNLTVALWFGEPLFATLAWTLIACALASAVLGWRRNRRLTRHHVSPKADLSPLPRLDVVAATWLLIPGAILIGGFWLVPVYTGRYLSDCAPAAAILMAIGLDWLIRGRKSALVLGLVVVVACATPTWFSQRQPNSKNNSDYAETSAVMAAHALPGDGVVFDEVVRPSRRPRLALHLYPEAWAGLNDVALNVAYDTGTSWYDSAYSVRDAATLRRFSGVNRLWLVEYVGTDSVDTLSQPELVSLGYLKVKEFDTHRSAIIEYVLPGTAP